MDLSVLKGIVPFDQEPVAKDDDDDPTTQNLPRGVFRYNRQLDDAAEVHLEEILGTDNTKALRRIAKGENVRPLPYLRQEIYKAVQDGRFNPELEEDEKMTKEIARSPKDDKETEEGRKILNMLGKTCWGLLVFSARSAKMSNVAALQRAVARCLNTPKVLRDIEECERAQAELERNRTASVALNNILQK